jgi:hypothetical protein
MRPLGIIVRLQIQRSSLKTGSPPNRVYDPEPILAVERLALGPDGVFGIGAGRGWIVDIHHRAHPDSKNPDGEHGISIGFTGHYVAMRDRFGDRLEVGCAGENIIVDTPGRLTLDALSGGIAVLSTAHDAVVQLRVLDVAHPCRPFTGWALGRRVESDVLREHLQFLEAGMRGFLCRADQAAVISVGDRIAVLEGGEGGSGKGEG